MPRKKAEPDDILDPTAPVEIPIPHVDVLERSIIDPFGAPSVPIELKDPQFVTRWVNTELQGGSQMYQATQAGYLKVRPEFLAYPDRFQFNISPDGFVTRGERHREILMYTTKDHQKRRAWAKTEANMRRMRMSKDEVQKATAEHFGKEGDEAANFVGRHIGGVTDNIERIQRGEQS